MNIIFLESYRYSSCYGKNYDKVYVDLILQFSEFIEKQYPTEEYPNEKSAEEKIKKRKVEMQKNS